MNYYTLLTHNRYIKILGVLLLLFTSHLSPLALPKAHAEGISLKVSPSVIQIRAQSPSDVRAPFIIENQSNQSVTLKIGYKLFNSANSQEGAIVFLNDSETSSSSDKKIFEKMQILDADDSPIDSLDLGPKQQKKLQLQILLPKDEPSADYYFTLVFLHSIPSIIDQNNIKRDKKDQKSIASLQGGIGLNVLLAVGDLETPQGSINEFSTDWYRQSGPVSFTVQVKNNGLHYINPSGMILIKNIFGQTVGRVDIPPTVILKNTTRSLVDGRQIASTSLATQATWPEKFLLGLYSANISIAMSADGPVYNRTVRFAAFPLEPLAAFIVIVVVLSIFYLRVKKKIRGRH